MCGRCGLNRTCKTPRMKATGEGKRKILVVAEAPGKQEDERGTQLIGEAGQTLRKHLKAIGVDLDRDCWKTNAVICRPPGNRTPTPVEIAGCRPWLFKSIQEFKPNVILLLGGVAVNSVMEVAWRGDIGAMERWAGWMIPCQNPYAWIVPTYHPSYLNRMEDKVLDLIFRQHLKKAIKLSGELPPRLPDPEITIEMSPGSAAKAIREIEDTELGVAFDFETTSLKPEVPGSEILCCSMANVKRTIAYPWVGEARDATIEFLQGPCGKIGANNQFEERWCIHRAGGPVNNWKWDTVLAAHTLDNRPHICGLKFQSFVRMGVPIYDQAVDPFIKPGKNGLNRLKEVPLRDLLLYNGLDSANEWDLAAIQMQDLIDAQN